MVWLRCVWLRTDMGPATGRTNGGSSAPISDWILMDVYRAIEIEEDMKVRENRMRGIESRNRRIGVRASRGRRARGLIVFGLVVLAWCRRRASWP